MPAPSNIVDNTIKLSELNSDVTQKNLAARMEALTASGATQVVIDCTDIPLLTREHIWLLLQIQSVCQMHNVTVIITAPTSTLFNIETLGSLIEASSSLTKRVAPTTTVKPAPTAPAASPNRLEQRFRARASELAGSTKEFETFMSSLKIDKVDRYVLRTIYTEALQNIYRHAGLKDSQEIQIQAELTGKCLGLTFIDEGPEFDPTADYAVDERVSDPTAVEFPHFGIKMLRRLADDMSYQRSRSGKNVLRIIKELQL